MTTDTITRAELDAAYTELSAASGAPDDLIRDAALEVAGIDPRANMGFPSLSAEIDAVAFLAGTFGLTSGATMPGTAELSDGLDYYSDSYLSDPSGSYAASEVARLATVATEKITSRDGQVRTRCMIDPVRAEQALLPSLDRPELPPNDARMTVDQAVEVDRLLALTQTGLRKSDYPAVPSRRDRDRGTNIELAGRRIGHYLELAENGDTTVVVQSPDYHEVSVDHDDTETLEGSAAIAAEVDRFHAMANDLFGIAPMSTTGNASYAPGPESEWGQFRKGPWHSEYAAGS